MATWRSLDQSQSLERIVFCSGTLAAAASEASVRRKDGIADLSMENGSKCDDPACVFLKTGPALGRPEFFGYCQRTRKSLGSA